MSTLPKVINSCETDLNIHHITSDRVPAADADVGVKERISIQK